MEREGTSTALWPLVTSRFGRVTDNRYPANGDDARGRAHSATSACASSLVTPNGIGPTVESSSDQMMADFRMTATPTVVLYLEALPREELLRTAMVALKASVDRRRGGHFRG